MVDALPVTEPEADAPASEDAGDAALWAEFDQAETATAPAEEPAPVAEADPEPAAVEEPEQPAAPAPKEQPAAEPDIWAGATDAMRAAYQDASTRAKQLEHAERSNRGRIAAMQRQIEELRRASVQPKGDQPAQAGAANGHDSAPDDLLGTPEWKTLSEEYPEIAEPLGKALSVLLQKNVHLEKTLSAIGEDRRQNALDEQASLLTEAHPDWREVTADAALSDWLRSQPRHVREAAQRNGEGIVDAEEAADVVGRFKAWRAAQAGHTNGHDPIAAQASNGRGTPHNSALSGKRQRQLDSATSVRSRGPSAAVGIPDDEDGAWKAFERMGL